MERAAIKTIRAGLIAVLSSLFILPAQAHEGDTFRPFVSYTRYYDSNLFRLSDSGSTFVVENGVPISVTRQSSADQYSVWSAGLNMDWRPGRQQVTASVTKNLVRFSRYTSLDYDGSDYQLTLNWRLGNHWSGQAGTTQSVTQSSFAQQYGLVAVNNQVSRENRFANAVWQIHPRWSLGAGASATTSTNSTSQQAPLDYQDQSAYATLGYTTPKGSSLRGQIQRTTGEYPNRSITLFVDRNYTQNEYNLLGDWSTAGKLTTHAKIGYVQRENATLVQRNFSGLAGRVSADYWSSGKTVLNLAVYREIANSDDINASYQINTGTSLGLGWSLTSKLTLRANAVLENRNFRGNTGFILLGLPQRNEDTRNGTLSLHYEPIQMASIDLGLQAGRRDSNINVSDYTYRSVFVSVRADF